MTKPFVSFENAIDAIDYALQQHEEIMGDVRYCLGENAEALIEAALARAVAERAARKLKALSV